MADMAKKWAEASKGQVYRHPDGTLFTVKAIRKTHAILVVDATGSTDEEFKASGVFEDRTSLTAPVNPDLALVA